MVNSKKIKKIVAISIAAALMTSYSLTAFAGEASPIETLDASIVEQVEIDWESLDLATYQLLDKFTEEEKAEIADQVEGIQVFKDAIDALKEIDKGTALAYASIYKAASDIVNKNYADDSVVKNTFIAAQNVFNNTINKLDNAGDYEIFNTLLEKIASMDFKELISKSLAGQLTEDEFADILNLSKIFDSFSSTFQTAFISEYDQVIGLLDTNITNNPQIQAAIELFETRYEDILKKNLADLTIEDDENIKTAIAEYGKLSTMNKYALSSDYVVLLGQNEAIEALKLSNSDNNDSTEDNNNVSDSDLPTVSDSDLPAVSDSDLPAVSDSDITKPDDNKPENPNSGNGTVSDSDIKVSDSDVKVPDTEIKNEDSVTNINTGESNYVVPTLLTMLVSAFGFIGISFKKRKSVENNR